MPNLDGTDTLSPTPFDAHEQIVRFPHKHVKAGSADDLFSGKSGYVKVDYEHAEYPKIVGYVDIPATAHNVEGKLAIVAQSAADEAAFAAANPQKG